MNEWVTRRGALAASAMGLLSPSWADGPAAQSGGSLRTIRLGQSLPLGGAYAPLGKSFRDAVAAAFDEVNRRERETGLRYDLATLDDKGRPELTASNSRLLAEDAKVHALFGYAGEGADRAGAMSAAALGLPYVAPVSGAVELRSPRRPRTFVHRASHADEIRYIVNHAQVIGVTRLALVHELTFLGLEMRNAMIELLDEARRADLLLSVIDTAGSHDTVPHAVRTILQNNPQAVVLGSNDVASAAFVKAVRHAGYKGYLYTLSSVGSQGLGQRLGPLASGISVTQVVPFPLTDALPVSRTHRAFCARHRLDPSFLTMEAWMSVTLFHEAMKRIKITQPAEIARALATAPEFDFGGYSSRWFESTPNPSVRVSLTVYDRDGRLRV